MKYFSENNNVKVTELNDFSLMQTLECGQCFRFKKIDNNKYICIAFSRVLTVEQTDGNTLIFYNTSLDDFENIWREYFDLDNDYKKIKEDLTAINPIMKEITEYSYGIHILKQDSWEALCSYIISQNNNIPRIMKIIDRLCENFGDKIDGEYYTFPTFEKIASLSLDELSVIKAGFRDKYIQDAAKKLVNNDINLNEISMLSSDEALKELLKIKGVGPKVAKCTLLYGFNKTDCYPVDVWMKRANEKFFSDFDILKFGNLSGIAQQYIFYYYRLNH